VYLLFSKKWGDQSSSGVSETGDPESFPTIVQKQRLLTGN